MFTKSLFQLFRYALKEGAKIEGLNLDREAWDNIYKISKVHDLAHLIGYALKKLDIKIDEDLQNAFEKSMNMAIFRYAKSSCDIDFVSATLENAQIPFIPLKGSVLRKDYPQPWMRTSCDIDILIHQEDVEKAITVLCDSGLTRQKDTTAYDYQLSSPSGIHLELHYSLKQDAAMLQAQTILDNVWDKCHMQIGKGYEYCMSDEMFYFYHIAHMARHFMGGGCGIRPFLDLWILDNLKEVDIDKRDALLEKGNLLKFTNACRKLSRVWFESDEHDDVSKRMEQYVLSGGVYGSSENRISVQQQKKGGRFKYLMSRMFLSYKALKNCYPVLEKHPWLMPIMQVCRWFRLIFGGHFGRVKNDIKYSRITTRDAESIKKFLCDIGID